VSDLVSEIAVACSCGPVVDGICKCSAKLVGDLRKVDCQGPHGAFEVLTSMVNVKTNCKVGKTLENDMMS